MEAPGKGMLKVVSILLIIFGAIGIITSLIALAASSIISGVASELGAYDLEGVARDAANWAMIASVLSIVNSALCLVFGIMGIKKSADAAQGKFFIIAGIILCALALLSMIMFFSVIGLIGFVLPILFIIGGVQNKNAAAGAAVAS